MIYANSPLLWYADGRQWTDGRRGLPTLVMSWYIYGNILPHLYLYLWWCIFLYLRTYRSSTLVLLRNSSLNRSHLHKVSTFESGLYPFERVLALRRSAQMDTSKTLFYPQVVSWSGGINYSFCNMPWAEQRILLKIKISFTLLSIISRSTPLRCYVTRCPRAGSISCANITSWRYRTKKM